MSTHTSAGRKLGLSRTRSAKSSNGSRSAESGPGLGSEGRRGRRTVTLISVLPGGGGRRAAGELLEAVRHGGHHAVLIGLAELGEQRQGQLRPRRALAALEAPTGVRVGRELVDGWVE